MSFLYQSAYSQFIKEETGVALKMKGQFVKENKENIYSEQNVSEMEHSEHTLKSHSKHNSFNDESDPQYVKQVERDIDDEEKTIREYISKIIGREIDNPLFHNLQSGVVLCELANSIIAIYNQKKSSQAVPLKNDPNISREKIFFMNSKSPFIQRENIAKFIKFAEPFVEPYELFETEDLYSMRNPHQVKITLYSLSRNLKYRNIIDYCIGPQQYSHETVKKRHYEQQPIFTFYEQRKNKLGHCGRRQISVDMMLQPRQNNTHGKSMNASAERNVGSNDIQSCEKEKKIN